MYYKQRRNEKKDSSSQELFEERMRKYKVQLSAQKDRPLLIYLLYTNEIAQAWTYIECLSCYYILGYLYVYFFEKLVVSLCVERTLNICKIQKEEKIP